MKKFLNVVLKLGIVVSVVSVLLAGCGSEDSTSPAVGNANIEGQFVADSGANVTIGSVRAAEGTVYPVSGATVELIQNNSVLARTSTDEYGRFQFSDLDPGEYDVRVVANDEAVAHYHVVVAADQTLTLYGRVLDGECEWNEEDGPHWADMSQGGHWGGGFQGAAPGQGYWHDGQQWCDPQGVPQGTGPHGPGGSNRP